MPTDIEYAQLANRVYRRTDENRTPIPTGWQELRWLPDNAAGFSAGVYKNGNDIVISYTGTNEAKAADFLLANIPIGAGATSAQVLEAMKLYYETKAANPGVNISFTGHSLGGGLASMMAVFFDKPAVIFDPAPFELGAREPTSLLRYRTWALLSGYSDAAFDSYAISINPAEFNAREAKVRSIAVEQEVLGLLRAISATIYGGTEQTIPIGTQNLLSGQFLSVKLAQVELHSMTLLAAMLTSSSFANAVKNNSDSLASFFDATIYKTNPEISNRANFLDKLYIAQVKDPSNPLLDRFATDLQRIGSEGVAGSAHWRKALTVALMDYFYNKDAASLSTGDGFFKFESGALHFDFASAGLAANQLKSLPWLRQAMIETGIGDLASASATQAWHIQSGAGAMNWQDSTGGDDIAIGGQEADVLRGGAGVDQLLGGAGDDVLDGGAGGDRLMGGAGSDTYQLTSGELFDIIADSDGNGIITVDGQQLTGGKKAGENYWISDDKQWGYLLTSSGDLVISKGSSLDNITIRGWAGNGGSKLGIVLDEQEAEEPPVPQNIYLGDQRAPIAISGDGVEYYNWGATGGRDAQGNLIGGEAEAGFNDVIYGHATNRSHIQGLGGDDALGGGSGADKIEGGEGDDLLVSGGGADELLGGEGNDTIFANFTMTVPQRGKPGEQWKPPAGSTALLVRPTWGVYQTQNADGSLRNTFSALGSQLFTGDGVRIDAGAGNDMVIASSGDDRAYGGEGKDAITGLAGHDIMEGGGGDDNLNGDGNTRPGSLNNVEAANHGNDFIDGGAGNDYINGQGGNDQLFGGADDDVIWGELGDDYLDGEDGNDLLRGEGGDDTLYGGAGNDSILGDPNSEEDLGDEGNDYLDGEDGDDQLYGLGRDDTLYGGAGNDVLVGDGLVLVSSGSLKEAAQYTGNDYLDGEAGNDTLSGGGKDDSLFGGEGDDFLAGDGIDGSTEASDTGSDFLDGEAGNDQLAGGGKDDTLLGGDGNDQLIGDEYGTTLEASAHGNDYLDGEAGNDNMWGSGGDDVLIGGDGNDFLSGDDDTSTETPGQYTGNDVLDGGDGNDILLGGSGDDVIEGGAGDDRMYGGAGDDVIRGGDGNDNLSGGGGTNDLDGGAGDDKYFFRRGDGYTRITDASGFNRLYLEPGLKIEDVQFSLGSLRLTFAGSSGVAGDEIHIEGFYPQDPLNTLAIQEIVFEETGRLYTMAELLQERGFDLAGTQEADYVQGTALVDRMLGLGGNDVLEGLAGDDQLDGAAGDDYLDGGAGNDALLAGEGNDILVSDAGNDRLEGGQGDDVYQVSTDGAQARQTFIADTDGVDTLRLNWRGSDTLINADEQTLTHVPSGDAITISGADGQSTQDVSSVEQFEFLADDGSVQRLGWGQVFYGRQGVKGTAASDTLMGTDAAEVLAGLGGDDVLQAGGGDDLLLPGAGRDRLEGGEGSDVYDLRGSTGDKVIAEVGAGADGMQVNTLRLDWEATDLSFDVTTNSFVNLSTGQRVTIEAMVVQADGAGGVALQSPVQQVELSGVLLSMQEVFANGFEIRGTPEADVLQGTFLAEQVYGLASDDVIEAGAGRDAVFAGEGDDWIDGGAGADQMYGGVGADTYVVDNIGDRVIEQPPQWLLRGAKNLDEFHYWLSEGYEVVNQPSLPSSWQVQRNAQGEVVGWTAPWSLSNEDRANSALAYVFERASDGDLQYVYWSVSPEKTSLDVDSVQSDISYSLTAGVENLTLVGDEDLTGVGNQAANVIVGNAGDNLLVGSRLDGRFDVYGDTHTTFIPTQIGMAGIRPAESAVEERLMEAYYRAWFEQFDSLNPNTASLPFVLEPAQGDNLVGGEGGDTLIGSIDSDLLDGGAGDDTLVRNGGADEMRGGLGNDVYVNNSGQSFEQLPGFVAYRDTTQAQIIEEANAGIDTVISLENFVLPEHVENLVLTNQLDARYVDPEEIRIYGESTDILSYYLVGTGNTLNNEIIASLAGSELYGLEGDDRLIGRASADWLDGGAGSDVMAGGGGRDTYVVDSATDVVNELVGDGTDTVRTDLASYQLGVNVENLRLTGGVASEGVGNELDNQMWGNDANNRLDGGAGDDELDGGVGDDRMLGGLGNDTYLADSASDTVVELAGQGVDLVVATSSFALSEHVENLTLQTSYVVGSGNAQDNVLTSAEGHNTLFGMQGNDQLVSMRGSDQLLGGAGDDTYVLHQGLAQYAGEVVITEAASAGHDRVLLAESFGEFEVTGSLLDELPRESLTLSAHVEELLAARVKVGLDVVGNAGDNTIEGGSGSDSIAGMDGNDRLLGGQTRSISIYATVANPRDAYLDFIGGKDWGPRTDRTLAKFMEDFGLSQDPEVFDPQRRTEIAVWTEQADGSQIYTPLYSSQSYMQISNAALYSDAPVYLDQLQASDRLVVNVQGLLEGFGPNWSQFMGAAWAPRESSPQTWDYLVSEYGVRDSIAGLNADDFVQIRGIYVMTPQTTVYDGIVDWSREDTSWWYSEGDIGQAPVIFWPKDRLPFELTDVVGSIDLLGADVLDGGRGDDWLDGGGGNDHLIGAEGNDVLLGGADEVAGTTTVTFNASEAAPTQLIVQNLLLTNNDLLEGGAGNDVLDAGSGDDLLDGGTGIDDLIGGTGDDTYVVDGEYTLNAEGGDGQVDLCDEEHRFGMDRASRYTWTTDTITELGGQGTDIVNTTASVNLVDQSIEVVNLLDGGPVADLDATTGAGSQQLNGNSGNNRLDGGAGADTMVGGAGDDTYVVDDANDVVTELTGEGFDTVRTTLNQYTLSTELEGLMLEGQQDIDGNGNANDNVLIGNSGANSLEGGDGSDTLAGWRGNDRLMGGAGVDTYAFGRGDGIDRIIDAQGNSRLHFSGDITRADLRYAVSGSDLVITVAEGDAARGGTLILEGWASAFERVDMLTFCGGDSVVLNESLINRAPVAVNDSATAFEDGGNVTGNVLNNDTDPDGNELSVTNVGAYQGQYGSLTLSSNGSYVYALNSELAQIQALAAGQTLQESFAYTVADNAGASSLTDEAQITITVEGVNDGPVAQADVAAVAEDGIVTASGNVLTNDSDVDLGAGLTVANAGQYIGQYGTLQLQDNGGYSYQLNNSAANVQSLAAGAQVADVFNIVTTDGTASANASLTITVTGSNDGPVAQADVAAVAEDGIVTASGNVLTNDSDVDAGATLTVANAGQYIGQYGTLQLQDNGGYSYQLNNSANAVQSLAAGAQVADVFNVITSDGAASANASLTITVTGSNDGPVAQADVAAVAEDGIVTASGNVLTNDSDVDAGATLTVANAGQYIGQYGTLQLQDNGSYSYQLNNSAANVQSLAAGAQVADVFNVITSDGTASANANLTINITGSNDAPTLATALSDQRINANQAFTLDFPDGSFADIDRSDTLSYNATLANGTALPAWLNFNANGLVFTGTAAAALAGQSLEVRVTATDRSGATASDVFNVAISGTGCTGLTLVGTSRADRLTGSACDDSIDGRQSADTMLGGDGNDVYYVDTYCEDDGRGKGNEGLGNGEDPPPPGHDDNYNDGPGTSPGNPGRGRGQGRDDDDCNTCRSDLVVEYLNQGYDRVIASVSYVLPQHVEALTLAGSYCIDGTGNSLDNWISGNSVSNTLDGKEGNDLISAGSGNDCAHGGVGNDIIEGQDGNDWLEGGDGRDALFGGAGHDTLKSNSGKGLLAGGRGDDALYVGTEATVIAFNKGDGKDTVYLNGATPLTLSLGGGIRYEDIRIRRSGHDLFMDFNSSKSEYLKLQGYYGLSSTNRPAITLQMLTQASGAYNPSGTDRLRDNQVETFDAGKLIKAFDTAYAASSSLRKGSAWTVMNKLLDAHLTGSNTAALGGDLAYQFGSASSANLAGMGMSSAGTVLSDANFAVGMQTLNRPAALTSGPRLAG